MTELKTLKEIDIMVCERIYPQEFTHRARMDIIQWNDARINFILIFFDLDMGWDGLEKLMQENIKKVV